MPAPADIEEADRQPIPNTYRPLYNPLHPKPIDVNEHFESTSIFCIQPFFGPLLFENGDSDARDHCANERTFLSYLRLSVYMSIVSIAIILSFHLKNEPTPLERRIALPLGIVFFILALACLSVGYGNYIKTVSKYSRRMAIVQTGWKTQVIFTGIAISIVAVCILLLSTNTTK